MAGHVSVLLGIQGEEFSRLRRGDLCQVGIPRIFLLPEGAKPVEMASLSIRASHFLSNFETLMLDPNGDQRVDPSAIAFVVDPVSRPRRARTRLASRFWKSVQLARVPRSEDWSTHSQSSRICCRLRPRALKISSCASRWASAGATLVGGNCRGRKWQTHPCLFSWAFRPRLSKERSRRRWSETCPTGITPFGYQSPWPSTLP